MYYVYVLKSLKNKDLYFGFSRNLKVRFKAHNSGKVRSTKAYRPWVLTYYEAYKVKSDAAMREKELKIHAAKNSLMKRIKNSLKV